MLVSIALYIRNRGFIPDDDLTNASIPIAPVPETVAIQSEAGLPAPKGQGGVQADLSTAQHKTQGSKSVFWRVVLAGHLLKSLPLPAAMENTLPPSVQTDLPRASKMKQLACQQVDQAPQVVRPHSAE